MRAPRGGSSVENIIRRCLARNTDVRGDDDTRGQEHLTPIRDPAPHLLSERKHATRHGTKGDLRVNLVDARISASEFVRLEDLHPQVVALARRALPSVEPTGNFERLLVRLRFDRRADRRGEDTACLRTNEAARLDIGSTRPTLRQTDGNVEGEHHGIGDGAYGLAQIRADVGGFESAISQDDREPTATVAVQPDDDPGVAHSEENDTNRTGPFSRMILSR